MQALVIGGNGFIGTNLVEKLLGAGHQVRVFDRYPSRYKEPDARATHIVGDLGNHGQVHEAVKGMDWVFHLAYTTLPQTSNDDPVYDIRSNVVDSVQLLEECRASQVSKFVFISSGGTVYGIPRQIPISEDHPTEPICSYGITKLAIEKYLNLYYRLWGLEYVVARISNPYGEQQNPHSKQGAIGVFLGNLAQRRPLTIWGDGQVVRDYIYITDAAEALVKSALYKPPEDGPRIFNIGAGQGVSLNELVEEIRGVVEVPVKVNYTPSRSVDVPANVLDISRARDFLGWSPRVPMNEGLAATWKWINSLNLAG